MIALCFLLLLLEAQSAPLDDLEAQSIPTDELKAVTEYQAQEEEYVSENLQRSDLQDSPQTEKNQVQEWFENVSKNVSTNAQNAMNTFSDWLTKLAKASSNQNNVQQNLPTMYMGSFQLLKMPMPQMTDVIKGMGDLASLAQGFNKVTGGNLPIGQGIPLISG